MPIVQNSFVVEASQSSDITMLPFRDTADRVLGSDSSASFLRNQ
jgi:hypothetical protein